MVSTVAVLNHCSYFCSYGNVKFDLFVGAIQRYAITPTHAFRLIREASGKKNIFFAVDELDKAGEMMFPILQMVSGELGAGLGFSFAFLASALSSKEIRSFSARSGRAVKVYWYQCGVSATDLLVSGSASAGSGVAL